MKIGKSATTESSIPSLFLPVFQYVPHRGRRNNPSGSVALQRLQFLVARHQKVGSARFRQREQETVLWVGRDRARRQVLAEKREVPQARRQEFNGAGAKFDFEKWPAGDLAKLRDEPFAGDERELLPFPCVKQFRRRPCAIKRPESRTLVSTMIRISAVWRASGIAWPALRPPRRRSSSAACQQAPRRKPHDSPGRSGGKYASGQLPR